MEAAPASASTATFYAIEGIAEGTTANFTGGRLVGITGQALYRSPNSTALQLQGSNCQVGAMEVGGTVTLGVCFAVTSPIAIGTITQAVGIYINTQKVREYSMYAFTN
jgi:hypothetical protein